MVTEKRRGEKDGERKGGRSKIDREGGGEYK